MNKSILLLILSCFLFSCSSAKNDDKMMQAKDIIKLINKGKPVQIFDKIITDDLDFTSIEDQSVDANANLNHKIKQDIVFVKCVFLGKVISKCKKNRINHKTKFMGDVSFRTCDFRGETDLSESVINGNVNFAQSVFRENVDLNNLIVKGNSSQFWEIQAEKDFSMVNSKTFGSLNFMDAKFTGFCTLQGIDCDNFQFSNTTCDSIVDLSMSRFHGNVFMNYCQVSGPFNLNNCSIMSSCDILNSTFKSNVNLDNSIFYGNTRFNGTQFVANMSVNEVYFILTPKFENVKTNNSFCINKISSTTIEIK